MKKQVKVLLNIVVFMLILTIGSAIWGVLTSNSSSFGSPPPPSTPKTPDIDPFQEAVAPEPVQFVEGVFVNAHLEYAFDVLAIDEYYLEVRAHPGDGIPGITGGFVTTDVEVSVKLRGVSCPSACRDSESRARPHEEVRRERKRWADGMSFVTSLLMLNQSLRLSNIAAVDGKLVADIEFYLGNEWQDLREILIKDGFAKSDTSVWNWGQEQLAPAVEAE